MTTDANDDADANDGVDASDVADSSGGDTDERSRREPLGGIKDRVVGEDAPPASFPDETRAGADASDDESATPDANDDADVNVDDADTQDVDAHDDADANSAASGRHDGPLGDLAADVEGRRQRKTPADDELFDAVEVGEVDADALWAQVESEDPVVEGRGRREIREIDKTKYCARCPYFADPPEVACTHDGTDILEQVDMDHFEVADCPVVLEDERLENVTTE